MREPLPDVMTLEEAAALLRVEVGVLAEAAEAGEIPGRALAGQWRFSREGLLSWLGSPASPAAETA